MTSEEKAEPASAWLRLLLLFTFANFVGGAFFGQVTAFTPLYLPQLGLSPHDVAAWTGALAALSSAIGIPFLPLWGALADRYSRKPVIVRAFVAHLLASMGMLMASNIYVFVVGRALIGFALGNAGLMMTTLSERAPRRRLGLAFAVVNSALPVGLLLGHLFGGPIVDSGGFPTLLLVNIGLMLAVILMLTFGYRDAFKGTDRGPILRMALDSVTIIWRSPCLRVLFPSLFLLFGGRVLASTYVPLAVTTLYAGNETGKAVGFVVGVGGLATLALSPVVGALADRFGHWRILFLTSIVAAVLWPLPALADDLTSFVILWGLLSGIASSVSAVSFAVLSSAVSSGERGRVMAFALLPANAGGLIGPAIGSLVTRHSVFTVFPIAAAMTAAGVAALALAARHRPAQETDSPRVSSPVPDRKSVV